MCPECDGKTKVVDSGEYIGIRWRKRKCLQCKHTFWTEEVPTEDMSSVRAFLAAKKSAYRQRKSTP